MNFNEEDKTNEPETFWDGEGRELSVYRRETIIPVDENLLNYEVPLQYVASQVVDNYIFNLIFIRLLLKQFF